MTLYCRECGRKIVVCETDDGGALAGVIEVVCPRCRAKNRIVLDKPLRENLALT